MTRPGLLLLGLAVVLPPAAQSARFDVASVKRSPDYIGRDIQAYVGSPQPGYWRLRDLPVASAVLNLYPGHPLSVQLVGAPDWLDSREWYDIEARTSPSATDEEIRLMGRALLAERFKLALHTEQREVPAFVLVQRNDKKLGSGLKPPAVDCTSFRAGGERPNDPTRKPNADRPACGVLGWLPVFDHTRLVAGADTRITAGDVPISQILTFLGNYFNRPVVDRTNLTQRFDIELQFTADPVRNDAGPSIRTAVTEQLGLQVQDGRGPVEVLVIDHIERPTPD
jgi:uncharacterized protein (TIGR03435 family)